MSATNPLQGPAADKRRGRVRRPVAGPFAAPPVGADAASVPDPPDTPGNPTGNPHALR